MSRLSRGLRSALALVIALALLGLATEHEPRWDRMLMTNVPPR